MNIRKYCPNDFKTSIWQGGSTEEILILPEGSDYSTRLFSARISTAVIEMEKSVFTSLSGFKRFITPLSGSLQLTHDNEKYFTLRPFEVYGFDGDIRTSSFGKVRDFNLMLDKESHGWMKHWASDAPLDVKTSAGIFWLFSYKYNGKITLNNCSEEDDIYNIFLKPMELITITKLQDNNVISLAVEYPSDFLYGIINLTTKDTIKKASSE